MSSSQALSHIGCVLQNMHREFMRVWGVTVQYPLRSSGVAHREWRPSVPGAFAPRGQQSARGVHVRSFDDDLPTHALGSIIASVDSHL